MSELIEYNFEFGRDFTVDYIVLTQFSSLDLHKLREVDLVPFNVEKNKYKIKSIFIFACYCPC